jgi:xanthine dehydrogenase accessory factor
MADRNLQFFEQVAALKRDGEAFATATVVSRRSPVSSHLGDRAVVLADGRMHGFVGGACSREIVRRQAIEALAAGSPRLVQIRPEGMASGFTPDADHVVVPMSCASEGAVDVYIEPYIRPMLLLVVGLSPVADALAGVAHTLEYRVVRVVADHERQDVEPSPARVVELRDLSGFLAAELQGPRPQFAAVIATQGHYDEPALEALLPTPALYLGLLASRKRGGAVRDVLRDRGTAEDALMRIHNPAGLDLGATSPGEVAVSILAEIIKARSAAESSEAPQRPYVLPQAVPAAIDLVCGMAVEVATAMHRSVVAEHDFYFCCAGCKSKFEADPSRFLKQAGSA